MVVQHNMTAANANRMLGITTSEQAKSSEKLSSGYKINRAADDAAGLSISEKMRSQIRGLNKASDNAQDGVSAIQVAEGALNETHSILQRMNELATQAANDTNTTIDRNAIQSEMDALSSEIDRIRSTTQFNTQNLLDGSFSGKNLQIGALSGQNIAISISNMDSSSIGVSGLSVSSFSSAGSAMTKIQSAIDIVSTQRSALGAYRIVWSILFQTLITYLRIHLLLSLVSVIQTWRMRWLTTARIIFLHRQVSLCWLRLTRAIRVYYHYFSSLKNEKRTGFPVLFLFFNFVGKQ